MRITSDLGSLSGSEDTSGSGSEATSGSGSADDETSGVGSEETSGSGSAEEISGSGSADDTSGSGSALLSDLAQTKSANSRLNSHPLSQLVQNNANFESIRNYIFFDFCLSKTYRISFVFIAHVSMTFV